MFDRRNNMKRANFAVILMILSMIMFGCKENNPIIPDIPEPPEPTWDLLKFTLIDNGTAYEVSSDSTHATHIVIPSKYNGLPVTRIARRGFHEFRNLTDVTIPNSVTIIGNYAFANCYSLVTIDIPDSVTEIRFYAFSNCTSLTSLIIPDSVTAILDGAFFRCTNLESITLSNKLEIFYGNMFSGCSSLTSIFVPRSVFWMLEEAIAGVTNLTNLYIPIGVTNIVAAAIRYNGSNLTIYVEAKEKPISWSNNWNWSGYPVYWGATMPH